MFCKPAFLLSLVVALCTTNVALADTPPDFSGNWTLNTSKGLNLGMVKAVSEKLAVEQTPERLRLNFTTTFMLKTSHRQVNYDLSGQTSILNEGPMGDKAETLARWDGSRLLVTWTGEGAVAGTTTVKTEIRTLSADGKTMVVRTERVGKDPMELVYEKQ